MPSTRSAPPRTTCMAGARTSRSRSRTTSPACSTFSTPCPGRTSRLHLPPLTAAMAAVTTPTIQVLDAPPDLPFPHVSQAYLIERHVTALDGSPLPDIAALGVTSLDATRASPAAIAGLGIGTGLLLLQRDEVGGDVRCILKKKEPSSY